MQSDAAPQRMIDSALWIITGPSNQRDFHVNIKRPAEEKTSASPIYTAFEESSCGLLLGRRLNADVLNASSVIGVLCPFIINRSVRQV